jgi:TolA-binding protein
MNAFLRTSVGGWGALAGTAALLAFSASAQTGDPAKEKEAFIAQETQYIRQLQDDLRMPDFAAKVIEDLKKRYPDAAITLKILELRGMLSQGEFEKVRDLIARHPTPDGAEAWVMKLALADGFYAFGRSEEAFGLYDGFFKRFPQPTPEVESFYLDSAYKYPQMLLAVRQEKRALDAYRRLLQVKLPGEALRQVQSDTAELCVKVAEAETVKAAKVALLAEADKLASQLLWDQDMWFGKAIVTRAHSLVLRGETAKAQSLIDEHRDVLQQIHDALVAQERDEGATGLVRLSPMAQCRFLIAVMLEDEAMKIAKDPAGDNELIKTLLLGERGTDGKRKPNGAYQHLVNVIGKFPDCQWAMEAGEREQRIRAFIQDRFKVELKPEFTPEDYDRMRRKQFQEARQLFANNQFAASIPVYLVVLNHFPETAESVPALGELARACLESRGEDGYEDLLAVTITAHLAERFSLSPQALEAGSEVERLADLMGEKQMADKRKQAYDLFFLHFPGHPDAPLKLMIFGAQAAEGGDAAGALAYYNRLVEAYPASAYYGETLSRIAALHSQRQNYTNELATLATYMAHLLQAGKPGLAITSARSRIAQASRTIALARVHAATNDVERIAGSEQLIQAALAFSQVLKDLAAIPATVAIDTNQAVLIRQQAILQRAACLSQVVAPAETVAKLRPQVIETYLAFVKEFPQSPYAPHALIRVGTIYTVLQESEKAQGAFARLRQDYPASEEARSSVPMLAASLMEMGLRSEAVAKYKEMFAGPGADVYPDYQLLAAARALVDAGESDSALQGFARVLAATRDPAMQAQARLGRTQALVGMKKYAEARAELDTFVATYTNSALVVDAYLMLADAASAEGETEKDNGRRQKLFTRAVEAFKFVRAYRKENKDMMALDIQVGRTMIRKLNAEKALGLNEQAGITRGQAIVAFKQLIYATPPGSAVSDPVLEQAYLLSIPLELEHKKFQGAADACAKYLAAFASSPNAPQVRTWLNQANIELASTK